MITARQAELQLAALLENVARLLRLEEDPKTTNTTKKLIAACIDRLHKEMLAIVNDIPDDVQPIPNLIKVKMTGTDGRSYAKFRAMFHEKPLAKDIVDAQIKAGYSPNGYGRPWAIKTIEMPEDDVFVAEWQCAGSCD